MQQLFCQGPDWKPRKSPKEPGTCGACGAPLVGRNRWFCPSRRNAKDDCRDRYGVNHFWSEARREALKRAGDRCIHDPAREGERSLDHGGALEVNHIVPREGRGYGPGCQHHQDELEVLCHADHVAETTRQIRDRHGLGPTKRQRLEDELARWVEWAKQ